MSVNHNSNYYNKKPGNIHNGYDTKLQLKVPANAPHSEYHPVNKSIRSTDMHSFFANQTKSQERGGVFAYNPDNPKRESDCFEHKSTLLQSYTVPMKQKNGRYIKIVEKDKLDK